MSDAREWLIQWLRDAHAMEEQAETMLSGQLSRLENYPELSRRIQQHLDETKCRPPGSKPASTVSAKALQP
jgi:ferritin-like metal-binding protein YciE